MASSDKKRYWILIVSFILLIILLIVLSVLGDRQIEDEHVFPRIPTQELELGNAISLDGMNEVHALTGEYGYLLSYHLCDEKEESVLSSFSTDYFPDIQLSQFYELIEPMGMQYFLFVPSEYDEETMYFEIHRNDASNGHVCYNIRIDKDGNSNYTATLESIELS